MSSPRRAVLGIPVRFRDQISSMLVFETSEALVIGTVQRQRQPLRGRLSRPIASEHGATMVGPTTFMMSTGLV
jgi:hypothetical protein